MPTAKTLANVFCPRALKDERSKKWTVVHNDYR